MDEKQLSIFPTEVETDLIGKETSKISKIDVDSTKYRYPETKKPVSALNLEPIKINKNTNVSPEISKIPPLLVVSSENTGFITAGKALLKQGYDVFDLIEMLFRLAEQS